MALIILEPKEVFEHYHNEVSYSILLEGEVLFTMDNTDIPMQVGIPISTPGHKSHIMTNVGHANCVIKCGSHGK